MQNILRNSFRAWLIPSGMGAETYPDIFVWQKYHKFGINELGKFHRESITIGYFDKLACTGFGETETELKKGTQTIVSSI